jgi:ribonucleoside-triphosphate reductase
MQSTEYRDQLGPFVYTRTYSRWREDLKRRETWEETVERVITFFADELPKVSPAKYELTSYYSNLARKSMQKLEVMSSMRAAWAAGDAARASHVALYNCSFCVVDDVIAFSEILYVLMCGTGAGFSVEEEFVDALPAIVLDQVAIDKLAQVENSTGKTVKIHVADSKEGWSLSLDRALRALYAGHDIDVDYSDIRPRGARLKTMGGRASGPEPLMRLMEFARTLFQKRRGKKLRAIDCHDLICKIAEIVVVGGVRRSSLISLSDLDDQEMARAKVGKFWEQQPHRSMANNSAVFNGKPSVSVFIREFLNLVESGSGERGIFNREGAIAHMTSSGRRIAFLRIGTNPCGEILLRSCQFCNLTSVVIRSTDTLEDLRAKVRIATMIGMWQACFTEFPYLRKLWKDNCEEERLLGVSLNGIMDHPVLNHVNDDAKKWLADLKHTAISEARKWSKKLGINMSAAITCVKPEGTGSQMLNTASGIHPRYARFYIRRVRISATDPLFRMLREQGVPHSPENGQEPSTADTYVLSFPVKSPAGAKTRHDFTAIQQLDHWKMVREFWCEHNPSCTVYVAEHEWIDVMAWVYRNFDKITGLSFLPKNDDHVYQQAPYEEISEAEYNRLTAAFPTIDYTFLSSFELEDNTEGAKSYACTGDKCEVQ